MKIVEILGREIFNSEGFPAVQCQIFLENNISVLASVPAGKSKSSFEAIALEDGGERLFGHGVLKAIENIEKVIGPQLIGKKPDIVEVDLLINELDSTSNKSKLGANATLAVSIAVCRAQAIIEQMTLYELIANLMQKDTISLPLPFFNLVNGGLHATGLGFNNNLQIQEFLMVPIGVNSFRKAVESGTILFHEFKEMLKKSNKQICIGDEGGISSYFESELEVLDLLSELSYKISKDFGVIYSIGLDVAASQYYNHLTGLYKWSNDYLDSDQMINYYENLINKYPIYFLEDGLSELDWSGWLSMANKLKDKVQIIGDDIFATNIDRIMKVERDKLASAVIIKPNQIGTVTQTLEAVKLCNELGLNAIASHRSGETEDTFIADFAVGAGCAQIKAGNCNRERIIKYNRLLCIEDELLMFNL